MERPVYRFLHLVFALGSLHLLLLLGLEVQRSVHIQREIAATKLRVAQLEQQNQKLLEELQTAADPRYREGLVRQLGYVHKDERLYPRALLEAPSR